MQKAQDIYLFLDRQAISSFWRLGMSDALSGTYSREEQIIWQSSAILSLWQGMNVGKRQSIGAP